jgi:4-diphosphocytidyl-2-C-methyl-D-erythritol kinase
MYQLPFTDVLEIIPSETFVFQSSGLEIPGDENNNLCIKAFELIRSQYEIPNVTIHLHKIIPMGGGSSNASAVLKGLNALFNLNLPTEILQNLAAQLGSDCPLFIKENPQIAQGRGEILSDFELDLSPYYLKLVNVGIHVSTKEAFSKVQFYDHFQSVVDIVSHPVERWKNLLKNDFENSVFEYHPSLIEVKQKLYDEGAIYASMSGSGSTMYAIYEIEPNLTFHQDSGVFEKIVKL